MLRVTMKELKVENATLSASATKKSRTAKSGPVPAALLRDSKAIEDVARMFTVLGAPWTVNTDFQVPCPVDLNPFKPERYATRVSSKLGVAAELFHFVPPRMHGIMENTDFFRDTVRVCVNWTICKHLFCLSFQFYTGAKAQRSNMISRLRGQAFKILKLGEASYYAKSYPRATVVAFQSMLKSSPTDTKYLPLPPILHRHGQIVNKDVFLNPALPQVHLPIYTLSNYQQPGTRS